MNAAERTRVSRPVDDDVSIRALGERSEPASRLILGTRVDATSYQDVQSCVGNWLATCRRGYVCVASVHSIMEAHDNPSFKAILNGANLVTPDGVPLVWGLRLLGVSEATRVYGPDLTEAVCSWAATNGVTVGFHGSTDEVLDRLIANLEAKYPDLRVAYRYSPPFRALSSRERQQEIEAIRVSGAQILFVGLGCPKQERWIADRVNELELVMIGVGAAFDYLSGAARRPPRLIQRLGLEWLFRLINQPRRLWRRYLRHNPRFLYLFTRQLIWARSNREGL